MASTVAAAPAGRAASATGAPSRWRLLKQALVKTAGAGDAATLSSTPSASSVRRHAGFRLLRVSTVTASDQLAALQPPGWTEATATADAKRFQFVRYDLPGQEGERAVQESAAAAAADSTAASAAVAAASSAALASPLPAFSSSHSLYFRLRLSSSITLRELAPGQAVDNTGNVCVWASEEVLAFVGPGLVERVARGMDDDQQPSADGSRDSHASPAASRPALRVLELGAGQSGLAGLAVGFDASGAKGHAVKEVVITDGNEAAVEGCRYQIAWNEAIRGRAAESAASSSSAAAAAAIAADSSIATVSSAPFSAPAISASLLVWNREADYSALGRFDVVLAADCLFFSDYHLDLCHVLRSLIAPHSGRAFLLAPTRGKSLHTFVSIIEAQEVPQAMGLRVEISERYDERIWQQHLEFFAAAAASSPDAPSSDSLYSVDLHYPLLLTVRFEPPLVEND